MGVLTVHEVRVYGLLVEGCQAIPSSSFKYLAHCSTEHLYRSVSSKLPVNS